MTEKYNPYAKVEFAIVAVDRQGFVHQSPLTLTPKAAAHANSEAFRRFAAQVVLAAMGERAQQLSSFTELTA